MNVSLYISIFPVDSLGVWISNKDIHNSCIIRYLFHKYNFPFILVKSFKCCHHGDGHIICVLVTAMIGSYVVLRGRFLATFHLVLFLSGSCKSSAATCGQQRHRMFHHHGKLSGKTLRICVLKFCKTWGYISIKNVTSDSWNLKIKNLSYSCWKLLSFLKYFIYLSALGLLCGTQDLPSSLGPEGFLAAACGI